ncbi:bifunctional 4-hydroxyphenylacetate degradation enzyme [Fusarium mundagurra]|uniref:Bifunctional 4-hydroxyphenylacetate degradation enzyme n=1 Tax=Fusarium mundagurra TaxID=1567541 RepID=A0A8H5XSA6_9HYPO|nr:bifunctional 4-hydroxyphenylacetate degradation enzyme [Fusarium mundagurra]
MTERERQRDHKQLFIGKPPDTFCSIASQGRVGVSKASLPFVLKVETHVNGGLRQSCTTEDLIFFIPTSAETITEGQILRPSDVIATGTRVSSNSPFRINNLAKTLDAGVGLAKLNGKQLNN